MSVRFGPTYFFESTAFPVEADEDRDTNPGIFGRALATWIGSELSERGIAAGEPIAEDWGWLVGASGLKCPAGVACRSEDDSRSHWVVHAFIEPGFLDSLLKRPGPAEELARLDDLVNEILRSNPWIRNLRREP